MMRPRITSEKERKPQEKENGVARQVINSLGDQITSTKKAFEKEVEVDLPKQTRAASPRRHRRPLVLAMLAILAMAARWMSSPFKIPPTFRLLSLCLLKVRTTPLCRRPLMTPLQHPSRTSCLAFLPRNESERDRQLLRSTMAFRPHTVTQCTCSG